jgi:hypothetical protein
MAPRLELFDVSLGCDCFAVSARDEPPAHQGPYHAAVPTLLLRSSSYLRITSSGAV